jgi:hypothetical protein
MSHSPGVRHFCQVPGIIPQAAGLSKKACDKYFVIKKYDKIFVLNHVQLYTKLNLLGKKLTQ